MAAAVLLVPHHEGRVARKEERPAAGKPDEHIVAQRLVPHVPREAAGREGLVARLHDRVAGHDGEEEEKLAWTPRAS